MKNRGFAPIILLFIILLVAGGIWLGISKVKQSQDSVYSPSPTVDTTNWNLYINKEFTFKYPSDWRVDPINPKLLIASKPTKQTAGGDYNPGHASIGIGATMISLEKEAEFIGASKSERMSLDGVNALRLTGTTGVAGSVNYVSIVFSKNGMSYVLSLSTQDYQLLPEFTKEFDQILSTFKFN